jgi:hypothetical protein
MKGMKHMNFFGKGAEALPNVNSPQAIRTYRIQLVNFLGKFLAAGSVS